MWIQITTTFIDKHAADPSEAEVSAGKKLNVTAERGAELIDLGLAVAVEGEASDVVTATPAKAARPAPKRAPRKSKPPVAPVAPPAAPEIIAPVDAPTIEPGNAAPIDGHGAVATTTE
jgi:hypothetical protein